VIKPNGIKCVLNEGMPMYKNPFEKGRLIIHFNVKFPENGQIDVKKLADLEKLLPPRPKVDVPADSEEHTLVDLDPAHERSQRQDEYMEDDSGMHGGKRVQCANQ
jgi:DnaJ family protein A protein 1